MSEPHRRVLVVDDTPECRESLARLLERDGYETSQAADGRSALDMIASSNPDLVLLDMQLPYVSGEDVLRRIREEYLHIPVVMITGYGTIQDAVRLVKAGAFDFLAKPFRRERLISVVKRALETARPAQNKSQVTRLQKGDVSIRTLMGDSPGIVRLASEIGRVAPTDFSVLIVGETGSGKELVARAIHGSSRRRNKPFIALDCGALPENLIESELFGHEKGSFTGAYRSKTGKFQAAEEGTLFLDEISNLPPLMQNKLLRVLQERHFYSVGGTVPIKTDVRVIAASNRNLNPEEDATGFRGDLYHRISEYVIRVPSLRERKEDIPFLAERFIRITGEELGKRVRGISENALEALMARDWSGNVRELRNCIRRGVLWVEEGGTVGLSDLGINADKTAPPFLEPNEAVPDTECRHTLKELVCSARVVVERNAISKVLAQTGGNIAETARVLEVDYKTVHTKIKKYGIKLRVLAGNADESAKYEA